MAELSIRIGVYVPLIALTSALAACAGPAQATAGTQPRRARAFVLLDLASGRSIVENRFLAEARTVPASTFKIANTLIGLETGVIAGEDFALRWDGARREVDAWNRDHDLASAMRYSVVWFYQEVARRIGLERMRTWVNDLRYGDAQVGEVVDRFWLDGPLEISPIEQTQFLRRLERGELPVAPRHVVLVLELIELARGDDWVLRGKTGLGKKDGRFVGWLVGFVERGENAWAYAALIIGDDWDDVAQHRRPYAEERLRAHGVLP